MQSALKCTKGGIGSQITTPGLRSKVAKGRIASTRKSTRRKRKAKKSRQKGKKSAKQVGASTAVQNTHSRVQLAQRCNMEPIRADATNYVDDRRVDLFAVANLNHFAIPGAKQTTYSLQPQIHAAQVLVYLLKGNTGVEMCGEFDIDLLAAANEAWRGNSGPVSCDLIRWLDALVYTTRIYQEIQNEVPGGRQSPQLETWHDELNVLSTKIIEQCSTLSKTLLNKTGKI